MTFSDWLLTQTKRNDPIGDLANDWARDKDASKPVNGTKSKIKGYLFWTKRANKESIEAFERAWEEYMEYDEQ